MSAAIRVLELRSVRGTGGGPEKTILLGAERTDHTRFAVTVCYIRDRRDDVFGLDQRARAIPIDYVEVMESHSFDRSIWKSLRELVRDRRIDIVHAHDYKTDLLALLLARYEAVLPLATAHGWTGNSSRERWLYYPADRWLLKWFPHVVAVSSDIRDVLIRAGARPDNVTVILNGIDPVRFSRNRSREAEERTRFRVTPDDIVIGAVGRLARQKRFDILLDVFATLASSHPRLRLLIAGDGELRQALAAQIQQLGLVDRCVLAGHVTDVVGFHHALDLFVQSSDYEGTPNAVLEAMALETPTVATDAGGTAELMVHDVHGLITPRGDASALQRAIASCLTDRERARERAAAARRRVEHEISFEHRMNRLESLYSALVDSRSAGAPQPVSQVSHHTDA